MNNNSGNSERYIAVLCLSLKPNPLQGRKCPYFSPNIWLTSWLVDVCHTHLKLKPRWLSLEYHPPNWKISKHSFTMIMSGDIYSHLRTNRKNIANVFSNSHYSLRRKNESYHAKASEAFKKY